MDYTRYLRSKITVDDRALSMGVLMQLEEYVTQTLKTSPSECLRIVEVGAGVGAMFSRLYKRKSVFKSCKTVEYTMVDIKEDVLSAAGEELAHLFESAKTPSAKKSKKSNTSSKTMHATAHHSNSIHNAATVSTNNPTETSMAFPDGINVNLVLCDAFKYLIHKPSHFDIVIAAAVLDLWDVDEALPILKGCLNPSSAVRAFYFPITFDGVTDLFPPSAKGISFDHEVENIFHNSMGYRTTLGARTLSCHTGRRLIPALQQHKVSLRSVGGSAWLVYPNGDGSYHADEKYFLNCIISFIEATVMNSENRSHALREEDAFKTYLESRRKQVEDGTLYYLAHNIDVFCVV